MKKETYKDLYSMVCGDLLGMGGSRETYACKINPDWVVKIERFEYMSFDNAREMQFWNVNSELESVSKWIAPCHFLSPNGRVMIQERVEMLPKNYQLPDRLPKFLYDNHVDNFGLMNGNLVCFDYADFDSYLDTKLVEVEWRNDNI